MDLELSVFVDESGDAGELSDYYLITLVFHDQSDSLELPVSRYEQGLADSGLPDIPMHLGPLMNGKDTYKDLAAQTRRKLLSRFALLIDHLPFRYITLSYKKSDFADGSAPMVTRMKRDLTNTLFDHLDYLQRFDAVKIYYDNGQSLVTDVLHDAFEYVLARAAIVYRDASPAEYRLFQVADYACTLELASLKYDSHHESRTDLRFLGKRRTFMKNFLKKLRRHLL